MNYDYHDALGHITDPARTACFSGHRPEKAPFDVNNEFYLKTMKSLLHRCVLELYEEGFDTFICGMQRGVDIWAGQAVLRAKQAYPDIKLICVSPYSKEIFSRHGEDKEDYISLRDGCDRFVTLGSEYYNGCYQRRNRFMVENSSLLLAAVADMNSGTGQTISYAKKAGLRVKMLDLSEFVEHLRKFRSGI